MNKLRAYLTVAKNTWDEALTYRLNFSIWRLRNFLQLITTYFLWFTILPSGKSFNGYTQASMLTYILGTSFLSAFVFSTRTGTVADDIVSGNLSNYLIRPLNYFAYYFAKDIGDKAMNIFFSFFEVGIIIIFLRPSIFLQHNLWYMIAFLFAVSFAILLFFFFSLMLSFIGFWSSEVWAPRFIFFILLTFFAGGLFPLNILPKPIFWILQLLPFPYLLYTPMKIYLGQLSVQEVVFSLSIAAFWVIGLWYVTRAIWKSGVQLYSAEEK